jgi:hypothetical protein
LSARRGVRSLALCVIAALLAGAAGAQSTPAKKALVQRILRVQQSDIEAAARSLVEQPAATMMQQAGMALQQQQTPPEKFQAIGKQIEAEVKKYVDEALPLVRDKALKIAPTTIGVALETKMSEDELKQLLAWLESPAAKKFQEVASESRNDFIMQVRREAGPLVEPKLAALDGRIRAILGVPPLGAQPAPGAALPAKPPARPASK